MTARSTHRGVLKPYGGLSLAAGIAWGIVLVATPPLYCQDSSTVASPPPALEAADEAARVFEYEDALNFLEAAAEIASDEYLPLIRERRALYERYLGMSWLVETARDNRDRIVGSCATRDGAQLLGFIQLLELGVSPMARIGNRLPDRGFLSVRIADGSTRQIPARQIAQVSITWAPPAKSGWPMYWFIEKLQLTLQTGEVVDGKAPWALPLSTIQVRQPGADVDVRIDAYPCFSREFDPAKLVTQVVIIGAPISAKPPEGTP